MLNVKKKKNSVVVLRFLDVNFFMDSDPDIWLIRIRTKEENSDPDPKKTRIRNTLSRDF